MTNLDDWPEDLLIARGKYATIRSEHEDAKKRAQILCGGLSATAAQVLRAVQPDNDAAHDEKAVADLLAACRKAVDDIEDCSEQIRELALLRAELKPLAWPR